MTAAITEISSILYWDDRGGIGVFRLAGALQDQGFFSQFHEGENVGLMHGAPTNGTACPRSKLLLPGPGLPLVESHNPSAFDRAGIPERT